MSKLASTNYGNQIYWQSYYKSSLNQQFDWLLSSPQLHPILSHYIPSKTSRILYLGCGTSSLADHLQSQGYTDITCGDISKEVIKQMKERAKKRGKDIIKYKILDATKLQEENECYDVVIDKSMLDSLLCGEDYLRKVLRALREISRVLIQNGIYIMFSHESPNKRIYYLKNRLTKFRKVEYFPVKRFESVREQQWKKLNQDKESVVSRMSKVIGGKEKGKKNHYCYVCTRREGNIEVERQEERVIEEREEEEEDQKVQEKENEQQNQNEEQGDNEQKEEKADDEGNEDNEDVQMAVNEDEENNQQQPQNQQQQNNQNQQDKEETVEQQQQEDYHEQFQNQQQPNDD